MDGKSKWTRYVVLQPTPTEVYFLSGNILDPEIAWNKMLFMFNKENCPRIEVICLVLAQY